MAEVYRFSLPDGQQHAWHGTPASLLKAHPNAVVTGRLVSDDLGQGSWVPFGGKQPAERATEKAEVTAGDVVVEVGSVEPEKPGRKTR